MCGDFHYDSNLLKEGESPEKQYTLKRNEKREGKGMYEEAIF